MSFKIEKKIPLPSRKPGRERIYPFKEMDIGDSFLIPFTPTVNTIRLQRRVTTAAYAQRPKVFTTRKEEKGVRVWRVK